MSRLIADMPLLLLAEATPADAGRVVGQALLWVALFAGAWTCWSISRRPATNAKCALALMFMLLVFLSASTLAILQQLLGRNPLLAVVGGLAGLMMLAGTVAAIVFAIVGLTEFSKQRGVFVGRDDRHVHGRGPVR